MRCDQTHLYASTERLTHGYVCLAEGMVPFRVTALLNMNKAPNRPALLPHNMSNKFALSVMIDPSGNPHDVVLVFAGLPKFMRFKRFPEKRGGVHEILYRYL